MKMIHDRSAVSGLRRWALPVSLALNLFLVAVIGGHVLRIRQIEASSGASLVAHALANAEASLSKGDAARFEAVMRRDEPRYSQAAEQLAAARAEFERRVTAEPFDKDSIQQGFQQWQESWNTLMNTLRNPLIDALADVSAEGRQKLVKERRHAKAAGS
jgi:uncharacterized membrane protein